MPYRAIQGMELMAVFEVCVGKPAVFLSCLFLANSEAAGVAYPYKYMRIHTDFFTFPRRFK